MTAYKPCGFLVSLVLLGLFFLEAAANANSSLKRKDSYITVQNFNYGSAGSKVLMRQLFQMEKKLNELKKKVDSCFSGKPGSSGGKGRNEIILKFCINVNDRGSTSNWRRNTVKINVLKHNFASNFDN